MRGLQIPSYPALESHKKISAAWLVEHSGFSQGYDEGRVGLSRKHALAIVNRGEATAEDIWRQRTISRKESKKSGESDWSPNRYLWGSSLCGADTPVREMHR